MTVPVWPYDAKTSASTKALASETTNVNVSAATAPTAGQVLTADQVKAWLGLSS